MHTAAAHSPATLIVVLALAGVAFLATFAVLGPVAVAEVRRTTADWLFARRVRRAVAR